MKYVFDGHMLPARSQGLGSDLLKGAAAIADFVLGDPAQRRTIYHLAEMGRLPTFKLGSTICARRSTLLAWVRDQESVGTSRPSLGGV